MTGCRVRTAVAVAAYLLTAIAPTARAAPAAADGPAGEEGYRKPSRAIREVLDAPRFPTAWLSPTRDAMLLGGNPSYPPISDLAQPMLRLAGLRIDPRLNAIHRAPYWVGMTLKRVPGGGETVVALPQGAHVGAPQWSAEIGRASCRERV